ncbi:MAG: hypothetical protein KGL39_12560 [Patescibacteria group bacterium]|nr:hypothetical protein [Patescibacteria group bacterium]
MPKKIDWTTEQDQLIRTCNLKREASSLARCLGVSRDSIRRRARELGVPIRSPFAWTPEREALLRSRYVQDGPTKIAKEFGIGLYAVIAKARRLGLDSTRKCPPANFQWTEAMIEAIKERYEVEGPNQLAQEFGVTINTVYRKAADLGLHTIVGHGIAGRKRASESTSCDIHYFDTWSPNMAYVFGFLLADGNVNEKLTCISICLAAKDESVLRFIKEETKSTHHLAFRDGIIDPRTGQMNQPQVHLSISSMVLASGLVKLGLKPRKTYNNDPFPNVPDDMMPHFVRGYLDGDGTTSCGVGFVGSPRVIEGLRSSLIRLAGMSEVKIQNRGQKTPYSTIFWGGTTDIRLFRDFAYPEGYKFCLQRKKDNLDIWLSKERKINIRRPFTSEEEQEIRDLYHVIGPTKLAHKLGRDRATVHQKIKQLGLEPIQKRY